MKKRVFLAVFAVFSSILFSCGTGGGSDTGASVMIEIGSISPTYLEIDLLYKIDNDGDGTCEDYTIPLGDIIQVSFKSVVPEETKIQPSDVIITSYKIRYIPRTLEYAETVEENFKGTCLIPAGQTATCSFPIFNKNLKGRNGIFYRHGWFDDYDIEITFTGKEVIYDKTLHIRGNITGRISDIIQNGEPNCSF